MHACVRVCAWITVAFPIDDVTHTLSGRTPYNILERTCYMFSRRTDRHLVVNPCDDEQGSVCDDIPFSSLSFYLFIYLYFSNDFSFLVYFLVSVFFPPVFRFNTRVAHGRHREITFDAPAPNYVTLRTYIDAAATHSRSPARGTILSRVLAACRRGRGKKAMEQTKRKGIPYCRPPPFPFYISFYSS